MFELCNSNKNVKQMSVKYDQLTKTCNHNILIHQQVYPKVHSSAENLNT